MIENGINITWKSERFKPDVSNLIYKLLIKWEWLKLYSGKIEIGSTIEF
jgi:hypothetical protein